MKFKWGHGAFKFNFIDLFTFPVLTESTPLAKNDLVFSLIAAESDETNWEGLKQLMS